MRCEGSVGSLFIADGRSAEARSASLKRREKVPKAACGTG